MDALLDHGLVALATQGIHSRQDIAQMLAHGIQIDGFAL